MDGQETNTTGADDREGHSSAVERYFLVTWCFVTGIVSIVGNTTVLISSVKYNAFKLDKVAIVLILNLAVVDICYAITVILPTIGSVVADCWIYGSSLCSATNYVESFVSTAATGFVIALNISKLTVLLFPMNVGGRSRKMGYGIAATIWCLAPLPIMPDLLVQRTVYFEHLGFRCNGADIPDLDVWLRPLKSIVLIFVPLVVISVVTLCLMCFVHRVVGLQKQSVMTLILVSAVFIVSLLPYGVMLLMGEAFNVENKTHAKVFKFSQFIVFLNFMSNPFIYFATVASFNEFIKHSVLKIPRNEPEHSFYDPLRQEFVQLRRESLQSRQSLQSISQSVRLQSVRSQSLRLQSVRLQSVQPALNRQSV